MNQVLNGQRNGWKSERSNEGMNELLGEGANARGVSLWGCMFQRHVVLTLFV